MKNKDPFFKKEMLFRKQYAVYVKNNLRVFMRLHKRHELKLKKSLEKKLQVLSLHRRGLSYPEIARKLKVSKQYVYKSMGTPIFRKRAPNRNPS